jgi:hypothetical protein
VPTPEAILASLTRIANEWRWLAVAWHGALFLLLAALAGGWRPSVRTIGALLAAPAVSVGALAWLSGNPFNGSAFLVLTVLLALGAWRRPNAPVAFDTPAWIARGGSIVAFGAIYPHFVQADSWAAYLVASPFGLVPCPTLAVVAGLTLIIANLRTGRWTMPLFAAGLLYAAFGVFRLGVQLDWGLFIAITLLGVRSAEEGTLWRSLPAERTERETDALLDRFIPDYDVVERHRIRVAAPAEITLAAAREQDLLRVPLIRAIFRAREIVMRAKSTSGNRPRGLLATTLALGWGILAEVPGREVVVGAITRPWEADVTFRALPPGEFAAFSEPGFVKIVWTLRADRVDDRTSIFRTETRAAATDAEATARFRRYWAWASPGIRLIRQLSLRPLRSDAEHRARMEAAL